jgi:hypothetical protein
MERGYGRHVAPACKGCPLQRPSGAYSKCINGVYNFRAGSSMIPHAGYLIVCQQ